MAANALPIDALPTMPDINEGKPWSRIDDVDLRLAVESGNPVEDVATFLCRSREEVIKRAAELGLRWAESDKRRR